MLPSKNIKPDTTIIDYLVDHTTYCPETTADCIDRHSSETLDDFLNQTTNYQPLSAVAFDIGLCWGVDPALITDDKGLASLILETFPEMNQSDNHQDVMDDDAIGRNMVGHVRFHCEGNKTGWLPINRYAASILNTYLEGERPFFFTSLNNRLFYINPAYLTGIEIIPITDERPDDWGSAPADERLGFCGGIYRSLLNNVDGKLEKRSAWYNQQVDEFINQHMSYDDLIDLKKRHRLDYAMVDGTQGFNYTEEGTETGVAAMVWLNQQTDCEHNKLVTSLSNGDHLPDNQALTSPYVAWASYPLSDCLNSLVATYRSAIAGGLHPGLNIIKR